MRLDSFTKYPSGMEEYLGVYGWHFSKKMVEFALSNMYKTINGKNIPISGYTKDEFNELKERYNIKIDAKGYDDIYLADMCKADFLGGSIKTEQDLVMFVKQNIDDPDGYEGKTFTRFYADCIGSGTPILWEEMI